MKITLRNEREAKEGRPRLDIVLVNGREVGFIEKYPNTRSEWHPYKAFRGIGWSNRYIGAFYDADGGKDAAIRAIVQKDGK